MLEAQRVPVLVDALPHTCSPSAQKSTYCKSFAYNTPPVQTSGSQVDTAATVDTSAQLTGLALNWAYMAKVLTTAPSAYVAHSPRVSSTLESFRLSTSSRQPGWLAGPQARRG
eukprot:scaffold3680_cov381-Prasinococcus_capsulatus_cf.AAC.7